MTTGQEQLKYSDLDRQCNKWIVEFEENERDFNKSLIALRERDEELRKNATRISDLNSTIQNILKMQNKVESELDFISSQHAEIQSEFERLESECSKSNSTNIRQNDMATKHRQSIADMLTNLDDVIRDISEEVDICASKLANNFDVNQMQQINRILESQMKALDVIQGSAEDK